MANDLFLSMLSRNDLVNMYRDYYKDLMGTRPAVDPALNRAGHVDLIEELDLLVMDAEQHYTA